MSQNKSYLPLSGNKLFNGIQTPLKEKFPQSNYVNFNEGDVVYQSGDTSDCIYLILDGEIKVKIPITMGGPSIERKGKNEFFGEKELMENIPRRSSAVANTGSTLYKLFQKDFKKLISVHKKIEENILGGTAEIPPDESKNDEESFDESSDFPENSEWVETAEETDDNTENTEAEQEAFNINEINDQIDDKLLEELPEETSDTGAIEPGKTDIKEENIEEGINFDSFRNVHEEDEPLEIPDINEETVLPDNNDWNEEIEAEESELKEIELPPDIPDETNEAEQIKSQLPEQDDLNEEIKDESGIITEQNKEVEAEESELKEIEPPPDIPDEMNEAEQIKSQLPEQDDLNEEIKHENGISTEQNKEVEAEESELKEIESSPDIPDETNKAEQIKLQLPEQDDLNEEIKDESNIITEQNEQVESRESELKGLESPQEISDGTNEAEQIKPQLPEQDDLNEEIKNESDINTEQDEVVKSKESELKEIEPSPEILDKTDEAEQIKSQLPEQDDLNEEIKDESDINTEQDEGVESKESKRGKIIVDESLYKKVLNMILLINKENEFNEIINSITETLKEIIKADLVRVYIYNNDEDELSPIPFNEEKEKIIKLGEGITGWAAEKKEIVMLNSAVEDSRYNKDKDSFGSNNNVLLIPVVNSSDELEILILLAKISEEFTEWDKEFLTELSIYISTAIEKGKQFDSLLKESRSEYLNKVSGFIFDNIDIPVQIIKHYAEFIKKKTGDNDIVQIADFIREQTHTVTNSTEFFSDFITGKNSLSLKTQNLKELLNNILEMLAEYVETRNVKLFKKLEADTKVNADQTALYFVCLQITKNACDAMPEGGNFYLSTSIENNFVKIEFKDTGSGIPSHIKDRIFEPFFSFGKDKAAGLGLAFADKIIKNHGGKIFLDKTGSDGTTIIISLPIANE